MKSSSDTASTNPLPLPKWEAVERRIHEERKMVLPAIDTDAAIAEFDRAFQTALSAEPFPRTTGLIDQQACFSNLRKLAGRKR